MTTRLANVLLGSGLAATLVALVYYRLSAYTGSTVPWTLVLTGVATVLIACLRLPPRQKRIVAVTLASITASLYAVELVLANVTPDNAAWWSIHAGSDASIVRVRQVAKDVGVEIDTKRRIDVIAELRRQRLDAVPGVMLADLLDGDGRKRFLKTIATDDLLPLGGISNALTVLCNEGRFVTYQSDEHGFRNPTGIWNAARADAAVVGQSFTQGYCVPDGRGFVDLLRPRYPVTLNLGVSGESSLLQLGAIKEFLPSYTPKVVFWVFSEEIDLHDLFDESTHPSLMRYLQPTFTQHLIDRQPEIDRALRHFVADNEARERAELADSRHVSIAGQAIAMAKLWHLRERAATLYGADEAQHALLEETEYSLLGATLGQARYITSRWGGVLYFVYLPSWDRYRNGSQAPERERTRILRLVNSLGIPLIDIHPAFLAHNDPLSLFPFRRFGHYNEEGNRIVADTILRFVATHEPDDYRLDASRATPGALTVVTRAQKRQDRPGSLIPRVPRDYPDR